MTATGQEGYEAAFDNDSKTFYDLLNGEITFRFRSPVLINNFRITSTGPSGSGWKLDFYDDTDKLIKTATYGSNWNENLFDLIPSNLKNITKVVLRVRYSTISYNISEIEFFGTPKLNKFNLSGTTTVKKASLEWDNVLLADGYKIYKNGVLIETLLPNVNNYVVEGLTQSKLYEFTVEAFKQDYISSFKIINLTTKNFYSRPPTNGNVLVGLFDATIKYTAVPDTDVYEIRLDDGEVIEIKDTTYKFQNLLANTSYTAYVRQRNILGDYSEWLEIPFKTLERLEIPPNKPDKLTLLSKGQDFIELQVSETLWTDNYKFYLNNQLKVTQPGRVFRFENLKPDTSYSISVRSSNEYGDSLFPIGIIVRTDKVPVPTVTTASSSFVSGNPTKQNVTWQSQDVKQGFKIFVNGVEVGEVGADTNSFILDLADLELDNAQIEVRPIEQDGKSYKFNTVTKTTGDSNIDTFTGLILDIINTVKRAGMILLKLLLAFSLLFLTCLFLFNKFKLTLATKDADDLEANPDEQVKSLDFKNKFDKDIYFVAKLDEAEHATKKKEEFNFKKFLNNAINGEKKKPERKYKIEIKGKKVEVDKTTFHANKYADFKKLQSDKDFYQWQRKYSDYSEGRYNRYFGKQETGGKSNNYAQKGSKKPFR